MSEEEEVCPDCENEEYDETIEINEMEIPDPPWPFGRDVKNERK